MSYCFINQILAQIDLWKNGLANNNDVDMLLKKLDEIVAFLHFAKLGVDLETIPVDQAYYMGLRLKFF